MGNSSQSTKRNDAPGTEILRQGHFVIENFEFQSGETLPELRLHYTTLGKLERDAQGVARNAILLLHGTSGSGHAYLAPNFSSALFGPNQALDPRRWYVILPDAIGHGLSSKPSDGLRAAFPAYDYDDMVEAQYRLVTEGLGVDHLRMVVGISMGGMHTWVWGHRHPDFMDALMPMVCTPTEISGRNRVFRRIAVDAIRNDPTWLGGDYTAQPAGLLTAARLFWLAAAGVMDLQKRGKTRDEADTMLEEMTSMLRTRDANDFLYQVESSRNYNPMPDLHRIKAPLLALNAQDDFINPVELGVMKEAITRVPNGSYKLMARSDLGHGSAFKPALWIKHLRKLLRITENGAYRTPVDSGHTAIRPVSKLKSVPGGLHGPQAD